MLVSKKATLKPLLESVEGIHLTAYLVNPGDLIDMRTQLQGFLEQFHDWLSPVLSLEDQGRILDPIEGLLFDSRIFKQMKGNIGIFRNLESFRVLSVPVDVQESCHVASSFHVKPVLRWLQADQEFLLLGLEAGVAHLYLGSQDSFKLVDSIRFPDALRVNQFPRDSASLKDSQMHKVQEDETYSWLNDWITGLTKYSKPKLFIAGDKSAIDILKRNLKYKNTVRLPIARSFNRGRASDLCSPIRKLLKIDSKNSLEKSLLEFQFAEDGNRTRKNIFEIAKAVVRGKVRKLIVTDELSIFGKIDRKSGGLVIHPFDLDHEDDDILDDLAQMVLSQGGEVIVASRDQIPKGRPILAILNGDQINLERSESQIQYDNLQERFG